MVVLLLLPTLFSNSSSRLSKDCPKVELSTTARNPESMQTKLRMACKETRENETNFRFEQCKKQILTSLDIYQKTTLVIDAMGECDPQLLWHELVGVLKFLLKASKKPVQIVPTLAFGHVPVRISNPPMGWDGQQPKLFFGIPDCFIKL